MNILGGSREVTKLHEELPNPGNVGLDSGRAAKRQELPVEYWPFVA